MKKDWNLNPRRAVKQIVIKSRARVLNLYSLIYLWANFKSKIYPPRFFIFSPLQMPIVIDKSVNLLLTKFTRNLGQIYPPVKNPWSTV